MFANNRYNVDGEEINQVIVFETSDYSFQAVDIDGGRLTHMFNPNHEDFVWTHSDVEGAFYVINVHSLVKEGPFVAALNDTGHGKLLYHPDLGTKSYATNTDVPAAFPVERSNRTVGDAITLCEVLDDNDNPIIDTEGDGRAFGGTHDKAYGVGNKYVYFQCSGSATVDGKTYTNGRQAVVDTTTNQVVDHLNLPGRAAQPYGNVLYFTDGANNIISSIDTRVNDGLNVTDQLTVGDHPHYDIKMYESAGVKYGITTTLSDGEDGNDVLLIKLHDDGKLELMRRVEIGKLTVPEGARHFDRRNGISKSHFFTVNDEGIVILKLSELIGGGTVNQEVVPLTGAVSRVAHVYYDNAGEDHSNH